MLNIGLVFFITKNPLSLFLVDLCVNEICEAIIAFAGAEGLFAFPFISSFLGFLIQEYGKEKLIEQQALVCNQRRVSAHVEADLFVRLNGADKIIDCPAVWKLRECSSWDLTQVPVTHLAFAGGLW